jgi:hypothetical protein
MAFEIEAKNDPCEVQIESLFYFSLHTDKEGYFLLQNYFYSMACDMREKVEKSTAN